MKLFTHIITIALILAGFSVMGQDIHFSQFYNSPLTLNPALTGKINGTFRISAIYRDQWFGGGGLTYSTPAISFDMPIRLKNGDAVGVGINLMNDESKGGMLSRIQAALSAAYHKSLGANKNNALSLGVQVGFIQRRLDVSNLRLASQLDDNNLLNASIPSGENLPGTTNNFDINTGLMWTSKITSKTGLYLGISGYNLIQPISKFNGTSVDNIRRLSLSGGADIRLSNHFSLLPSLIYMREATAQETNFGVSGAIDVTRDFIFYLGAYYRVKDAFIPYIGADYKGFRLGLSYDAGVSTQWQGYANVNGSFEISLMYVGRWIPLPQVKPAQYCPRF